MTLTLILLSILGSALFAGLETGLVSLNRVNLRVRARRGDAGAQALLRFLQRPERALATFLVGNTLCNIGGGALASQWAVQATGSETAGSLLATAVLSVILLVTAEMAPKTYFRMRADAVVPRFLWFIQAATWVFAPVVRVTSALLHLITGPGRGTPFLTREELRELVRGSEAGLVARERRMLESVLDFGQTVVREVMIPLPEVVSISETGTRDGLLSLARQHRFTRIPVFRERVDAIVGLVNIFDVLYADPAGDWNQFTRPIHVVPETTRINRVLVDLQHRRESMALVVNEFGACIGIVTLTDILEEILGEFAEEHEQPARPLQRVGDAYVVEASFDIDDLNAELRLSLAKDRFDTVGGLILHRLGRIPEVGEKVRVGGVEFTVLAVHEYGLKRVRVRRIGKKKEVEDA